MVKAMVAVIKDLIVVINLVIKVCHRHIINKWAVVAKTLVAIKAALTATTINTVIKVCHSKWAAAEVVVARPLHLASPLLGSPPRRRCTEVA